MTRSLTVRGGLHLARRTISRSTAGLRSLPDFLIIGTQRGGTTSLYYYLCAHPQVLAPLSKEVHFFSRHWSRGVSWYRAHFPLRAAKTGPRGTTRLTFEATPYYLSHPLAPERAAEVVADAKLLVLLRDPVQRAWSHYRHMVRLGLEPLSFEEAIEREPERLAGEEERMRAAPDHVAVNHQRYSYLARGAYADQLETWLRHYRPDRFLVLRSEALFADPARGYRRALAFLGLRAWTPAAFPVHTKQSPLPRGMPAETRRRLEAHFAPANQRLEELLRRTGMGDDWRLS
jgi:Sulfotransferase domain